jgi:tetratricopeptide (TPR) repeat protein
MAYAENGDAPHAIARFKQCLQINPTYEPAHYHLGIEFTSLGKPAEASAEFMEGLKRDPGSPELHNDLGVVLAQQGKTDEAMAHFKQAIQIDPNNPSPYVNYANVLQRLGQNAAALENFNKAHTLAPNSPEVLQRLATLLATCPELKLRDVPSAVKFAKNAVELTQRQDPRYLSTLAMTYAAARDFKNAIATAQTAFDMAQAQQLSGLARQIQEEMDSYRRGDTPGARP